MKLSIGIASLCAYIACIWGANWALETYGFVKVWPNLMVPAGVYFVGISFVLRDFTQELLGRWWVLGAIIVGAALSYFIAPSFALASGVAFLLSESFDFAVYTPLREKDMGLAVLASSVAGALVDSIVFLWIAFSWSAARAGYLDLTIAKIYMALPFAAALWGWRTYRSTQVEAA